MKNIKKIIATVVMTLVMVLGLSTAAFAAPKAADGKVLQFGISILGEQPENGTSQYQAKDYLHLNTSTFKFDSKLTVCEEVHNTEIGSSYSNDTILARIEGYVPTLEDFINYPAKGEKGLAQRDIYLQNKDTFLEEYYIRWYVLKLSGGKWKIDGVIEKKPVVVEETVEEEVPVVAEEEVPVVEEAPVVEEVKEEAPVVEAPVAEEVKEEAPVVAEISEEALVVEAPKAEEVEAQTPATEAATEETEILGQTYEMAEALTVEEKTETKEIAVEASNNMAPAKIAEVKADDTAVLGATSVNETNATPAFVAAALATMTAFFLILFAKRKKEEEEENK